MSNRRDFLKFSAGSSLALIIPSLELPTNDVIIANELQVERYSKSGQWEQDVEGLLFIETTLFRYNNGKKIPMLQFQEHVTGMLSWQAQLGCEIVEINPKTKLKTYTRGLKIIPDYYTKPY